MDKYYSPFVSVIIPVHNDSERLQNCLEALENQTYPKDLYEVIVVDNGSDNSIESVVNLFNQAFASYESTPGSYAARNKGISLAKGEILAFTDADCIPAFNWLETGVRHLLSTPKCGIVGGQIELFFKSPTRPTAVEIYESVTYLQQKSHIEKGKYGATANIFTFKRIVDKVGNFNSKLKSRGDAEFGQRVFAHGYSLIYADDCCVAHPARYSFAQLYKRIVRIKGGTHELNKSRQEKDRYFLIKFMKDLSGTWTLKYALTKAFSDKRLKSNKQRIQVFFMILLVHYLKIYEDIRLNLGGNPSR